MRYFFVDADHCVRNLPFERKTKDATTMDDINECIGIRIPKPNPPPTRVFEVLEKIGLEGCADTMVGSALRSEVNNSE